MPTFIVKKSSTEYSYLQIDPKQGVVWTPHTEYANKYPSRYAAKNHLKRLDNIPDTATLYELR